MSSKKQKTKEPAKAITNAHIERLLKEAILKNFEEKAERKDLEVDSMISVMEEFMRSFIVIGYDLDNNPLVITNARTQVDADALQTALARLFFSVNNGNGGY
jgi:hypothetical protein